MSNVFIVSTDHIGGAMPWRVQVLDNARRVIKEETFSNLTDANEFKEEQLNK